MNATRAHGPSGRIRRCSILLAAEVPVEIIARSVGVSSRTLRRWRHRDDLRERIAEAREQLDALSEARLVGLISRAAETDWTAAAWWLERRHPERWGPTPERSPNRRKSCFRRPIVAQPYGVAP